MSRKVTQALMDTFALKHEIVKNMYQVIQLSTLNTIITITVKLLQRYVIFPIIIFSTRQD